MSYNFDELNDRRNTLSLKWDVKENELPMWVADMDFKVSNKITEGFIERLKKPSYGYTILDDEFYNSYINWWDKRHNYKIDRSWLIFSTGVVPTISSCVRRLTEVANNVVVLTPVYNIFFNSILNNGRHPLECNLINNNGYYEIDFKDLEEKLKLEETSLLIFCNPHNPVGRVWTKEELEKVGMLCHKYHVTVISDEIHCDLTRKNQNYIPFQSVNEINKNISVMCISPTKAFNIAGIQTSAIVVPNPYLRHKVERGLNTDECAEPNILAALAPSLAFKSDEWLDDLRTYLDENILCASKFIKENLPMLKMSPCDATYLIWIDCTKITKDSVELRDFIREKTGLYLSDGTEYGNNGKTFLRMNLATRRANVIDGLNRLKQGIELYLKK